MTRSMTRWTLAGCMALAALSAVAVLDVGSAPAEAAPSVSPFAGTYVESGWPVPITVSDRGHFTSSYAGPDRAKGSIDGRVDSDGSYSYTLSYTFSRYNERRDRTTWHSARYELAGTMALNADGDIVVSPDSGGSYVWLRQ